MRGDTHSTFYRNLGKRCSIAGIGNHSRYNSGALAVQSASVAIMLLLSFLFLVFSK